MTVQYQLTFEDFREAARYHNQSLARRRSTKARLILVGTMVGVWVLTSLIAPLLLNTGPNATSPRPPLAGWLDMFMPFLAFSLMFGAITAFSNVGSIKRIGVGPWLKTFVPLLFIGLILLGSVVLLSSITSVQIPGAPPPPPTDWGALFYPHISWLLMITLFAIFVAKHQRTSIRRAWDGQKNLHRPHTLDMTVQGVTVSTPLSRSDYHWDAIPKFLETPNMLILYVSDLTFHLVPKRALATLEELEAFRSMCKNLISTDRQGFEVVPQQAAQSQNSPT
jgi:hypothetical protein